MCTWATPCQAIQWSCLTITDLDEKIQGGLWVRYSVTLHNITSKIQGILLLADFENDARYKNILFGSVPRRFSRSHKVEIRKWYCRKLHSCDTDVADLAWLLWSVLISETARIGKLKLCIHIVCAACIAIINLQLRKNTVNVGKPLKMHISL